MNKSNFAVDLKRGQAGEELLLKHWPGLVRLDGRKADFRTEEGKLLELKTDSYDMNKTANFFIERWSDVDQLKPGSVWQSSGHGVDLFVYMFPANKTYFIFKVDSLLAELEPIIKDLEPVHVPNRSWTTVGYKVPRAKLAHLAEQRSWE